MKRFLPLIFAPTMAVACLPTDTRPPPTEVLTTLSGSALVRDGFTTSDGWKVTFDRYLLSFGNPTLGGHESCNQYADAGYRRIFDASVVEAQKVGIDYGLGPCDLRVRFANPNDDSLLGIGVTEADKTFMRTPGNDTFNPDVKQPVGISVWVKGRATKDATTKTFTFAVRTRRLQLQNCVRDPAATHQFFTLAGGGTVSFDFFVHPEAPFRAHRDPLRKETWFAPFAKADDVGNKDGDVSLDELVATKIEDVGLLPDDLKPPDAGVPITPWKTFADFVWANQFPRVVGLGPEGTCTVGQGGRGF